MRKLISFIMTASLLATACGQEKEDFKEVKNNAMKVELTQTTVTLRETTTASLGATVRPWNTVNTDVVWSSENPSVATVSDNGEITAVKTGETNILATCNDAVGVCKVTVIDYRIPATKVTLGSQNIIVKAGETAVITATAYPSSTTDQVAWSSSDPDKAEVNDAGVITGKSNGYVTITGDTGDTQASTTVLVHGDLWLEQLDPLTKPVSFLSYGFKRDTLRVARGETSTVQMVVRSDAAQGTITPQVSALSGVGITPKLYWVRDIKCSVHWDAWCGGPAPDAYDESQLYIPDPLMPVDEWTVNLSKDGQSALWAEYSIPRDCAPGIYDGTVKVSGTDSFELPFTVQVYDASLPEKQSLTVINWLNGSLDAMNGNESPDRTAKEDLIYNTIVPFMNDYGQNAYRMYNDGIFSFPNWGTINPKTGKWWIQWDFSNLGKLIENYLKACPGLHQIHANNFAGTQSETSSFRIHGYQYDDSGNILHYADGTTPLINYTVKDTPVPEVEAYLYDYFSQLQDYLVSTKLPDGRPLIDVYVQTIYDEPQDRYTEAWNRTASYVKGGGPKIKILEPNDNKNLNKDYLDYPCPTYDNVTNNPATGNQTQWIYTCMGPQGNYANRFIRIPLLKTRIVHWMNYKFNAPGYLHWGLLYWMGAPNGDPWSDAAGDFIGGDMFIIYPGYHKVYPSIRLCAMRDGINDYELLREIEAKSKTKADEFLNRLVLADDQYDMNIDDFRQLRKEMLEYLTNNK